MTGGKADAGSGDHKPEAPPYYGTFQDQPNYPQPVPPSQQPHYPQIAPQHHAYQHVPGYPRVVEGRPPYGEYGHYRDEHPLPFCGLGFGWFLFILGFVCIIPWYIGAFIFGCLQHDFRERSGLIGCVIAAVVFTFFGPGLSKGLNMW